jgi:hypothetical protein
MKHKVNCNPRRRRNHSLNTSSYNSLIQAHRPHLRLRPLHQQLCRMTAGDRGCSQWYILYQYKQSQCRKGFKEQWHEGPVRCLLRVGWGPR